MVVTETGAAGDLNGGLALAFEVLARLVIVVRARWFVLPKISSLVAMP